MNGVSVEVWYLIGIIAAAIVLVLTISNLGTSKVRPVKDLNKSVPESENKQKAEELWSQASKIKHSRTPDRERDEKYLKIVYEAAELGHLVAISKLSDYAYRQDWFVESYFWAYKAMKLGAADSPRRLEKIRNAWLCEGAPSERENITKEFTEARGILSRALMCRELDMHVEHAEQRIKNLIAQGDPDALFFTSDTFVDQG